MPNLWFGIVVAGPGRPRHVTAPAFPGFVGERGRHGDHVFEDVTRFSAQQAAAFDVAVRCDEVSRRHL